MNGGDGRWEDSCFDWSCACMKWSVNQLELILHFGMMWCGRLGWLWLWILDLQPKHCIEGTYIGNFIISYSRRLTS